MTKISTTLPRDNGLNYYTREFLDEPDKIRPMLVLVATKSTRTDYEKGETEPTVSIRGIEPFAPQDASEVERLFRRGLEYRSGKAVLSIELEDSIDELFANVDLTTGEIVDGQGE